MQNYTVQIQNLSNPTFQQIRRIAIQCLPNEENNSLYNKLKRGVALLKSHEELCKYLFSFGGMHEAKIRDVVQYLPANLLDNDFEIVDWGCGQALATICFFDYLKLNNIQNNVQKVTLIEPASITLSRAKIHIQSYLNDDSKITSILKYIDDVSELDIKTKSGLPVIHFFSNILDIPEIDLKKLANKINNTVEQNNYIVAIGPLNAGNKRIDGFYNYFNVPLIYNKEDSQFQTGKNKTHTYKANVYKLGRNINENMAPLEFYPSTQFHSAYQLDGVNEEFNNIEKNSIDKLKNIHQKLMSYELAAPFDIGASVYDDIYPIFAVLNNIVTRGLPTKASPFIEDIFKELFSYSKIHNQYGSISYPSMKTTNYSELLSWFDYVVSDPLRINYEKVKKDHLQLVFTPIAIARVQKTVLEALIGNKLKISSKKWKVLVEEKDVPCSAIAFADLEQMFNNLTKLSQKYNDLIFPEVELDIVSNQVFVDSGLHLRNKVDDKIQPKYLTNIYDLVIDIAVFETANIGQKSFSKFNCLNDCYFNIRSSKELRSKRNIYTTDSINYKDLILSNKQDQYIEIAESKATLEYFLQLIFRKKSFKAGQLPILNRALQNKSVIGLLPTGGGKSLTYQLAAMLQPGVTLIVDPLRSLMKDQYDGLINVGIDSCAYINSTLSTSEKNDAEIKMEQSRLIFLFVSPERLVIYKFREKLKNMHELNVYFSYGVIDEVHCVSEWGHDFRFSYLHLGRNLYNYVLPKKNNISLFGLTATASFDVLADVERELSGNGAFHLDSDTIVRSENSDRLELQYKIEKVNIKFDINLNYDKHHKIESSLPRAIKVSNKWGIFDAKQSFVKEYINKVPSFINEIQTKDSIKNIKRSFEIRQGNGKSLDTELEIDIPNNFFNAKDKYEHAGIIFCPHRASTGLSVEENKKSLLNIIPDIGTFFGDGDKKNHKKNYSMENLELFRANKKPLMVATKAFGMGIDKPNVRFTINMNYCSSLESFVQEAGRAGRDRKIALAVILLSDYKLARISRNCPQNNFPLYILKGHWFTQRNLTQIIKHYNLNIEKQHIDHLTTENDLVRLFCREGRKPKYFAFAKCDDKTCRIYNHCQLRKVPIEAENWIMKDDLIEVLDRNKLVIDKKFIEYQNADYGSVMFFYNSSFKGELVEKHAMFNILCIKNVDMFYGNDAEIKTEETTTVKGFLTTLLSSEENQEIVSFVKYKDDDDTDIAKAIYRMTCIGLIEDFTQDYINNRYRIVSKRKKEKEYYNCLFNFLLRYYSADRAKEEIKNVYKVKLYKETDSDLEKEIFQCLSYLTTFVYDKISVKRKRAIDDMRNFCITGANSEIDWKEANEELKDFIYYYFNSKYAKADYVVDGGEPYSIMEDTDNGKISAPWILFKYLAVFKDGIDSSGTPIDNIKHLQGAVRLLRRSLTDENPTLSLLNAFCIFFLGTNNNENLENEGLESYRDGMHTYADRVENLVEFWEIFDKYNTVQEPFLCHKLKQLRPRVAIEIHENKLNNIITNYIG